ncbi:MAG: hypothetical protein AB7R40_22345 [Nitrospiraceae bacterium]
METDKLTTILRYRLRSVTAQINAIVNEAQPSDERRLINSGWLEALSIEQSFLTDLIARLDREGAQQSFD